MLRVLSSTLCQPLALFLSESKLGKAQTAIPPRWREYPFSELSGIRTPTEQFFLRSHLNYPRIEAANWELTIDGAVRQTLRLSLDRLQALPSVTRMVTFECSGNPPGGGLIGTAEWRGVPLSALLEKAGLASDVIEVVLEGADFGLDEAESVPLIYARSIPLEKALASETLIAWEMNGEPLLWEHGFPVRAVVPGYYAMSHVKWLTRIKPVNRPFAGFYMTKRYITARRKVGSGEFEIRPEMRMKIKSQIARPTEGEQISGNVLTIAGAAWTGEGTFTRVEVSTDGGVTWNQAQLQDKPEAHRWSRWQYLWRNPENGARTLVCRAFDDRGGAQPEAPDGAMINRYGNNWYHRVSVTVRRG